MKVVKRDGRIQDFDLNKIKTSISGAADDANQPLNESDIGNLAKGIKTELENLQKDTVSFDIIQEIVLDQLEKSGFNVLAKYYNLGKLE